MGAWLDAIGARRDLPAVDREGDGLLAKSLAALPKDDRRQLLLAYLGYPFYDIATLPLLQGEGFDEFDRSEEHTSELQSLMRNSYAVFCLKKKIIYLTYKHILIILHD